MKIIKVPFINGLGKTKGCEKAPDAILKELETIYSNEQGKIIDFKLLDIEEFSFNKENIEVFSKKFYEFALNTFKNSNKIVLLGGDHSLSYVSVKSFLDHCNVSNKDKIIEPCLIIFDAHPDCMTPMKEPTHEEWLRKLIEDGFPSENIILVGLRNSEKSEITFLNENNVKRINLNSFFEDFDSACDSLMEFVNGRELYISIDIDVIDPAFAPATSYPEPGGFSSREFIYLLQRLNKIKTIRVIDIVEINSEKDKNYSYRTTKLGAKILSELL